MSSIFSYFTKSHESMYFPGAAMLLGAVLTLFSAVLARMTLKKNLSGATMTK
jgi:DHA1 family tetracycline resistance protein-like MFS transporter